MASVSRQVERRSSASASMDVHQCAAALVLFGTPSFGAAMYVLRSRRKLGQAALAFAAGVSSSYYSELENSKRLPPPRQTALRIASAFGLTPLETQHFLAIAESERAAALHDAHLPMNVRQLIAAIRVSAATAPPDLFDRLHNFLQEEPM